MRKKTLCLTIYHNICLDKKQRYKIGEWIDTEVAVTGVSVPVWCQSESASLRDGVETDEPGKEIFCRYIITNKKSDDDRVVDILKDGYRIFLTTNRLKRKLLDVKDGGAEYLSFTYNTYSKVNNREYPTVHFVTIQDVSALSTS